MPLNQTSTFFLFLCISSFLFQHLIAQDTVRQQRLTVAVLDFDAREGVGRGEAASLSDVFSSELIATKELSVVDRNRIKNILEEQSFQYSEACSQVECIVEAGKILKVEKMFGGTIGKVGRLYTVNIQIIDITTAQIVINKTYQHDGDIEDLAQKVIPDLAIQMAEELIAKKDLKLTASAEKRSEAVSEREATPTTTGRKIELKLFGPRAGVGYVTDRGDSQMKKGVHSAFGWQVELPYVGKEITGYGEAGLLFLGIEQGLVCTHVWGYFGFRLKHFGIGAGPVFSTIGIGIGLNSYALVEIETLRIPIGMDINFIGKATRYQFFFGFNYK
jgi:TolB-like protein